MLLNCELHKCSVLPSHILGGADDWRGWNWILSLSLMEGDSGSGQFSSVAQLCLTLGDPMHCSTPGFPVHHQLPEFAQNHVHQIGDAIQPLILSSPSPPAFNLAQHQGLFQSVSSLHQVAKVLEFQLQYQSFHWIFRTDFLYDGLVGSPCSSRDSQESSPTPQFKSINSCRFLDRSHSDWCEVVPHCGVDLHFSNNEWCWASFHVFVSHPYVFFGEMSI